MSDKALPKQRATLGVQLVWRVLFLSLIAGAGLVAVIGMSLGISLQATQRQLQGAGMTVARDLDEFLSSVKSDLRATSDALAASRDADSVFQRTLERHGAISELVLLNPQGQMLAQRRGGGEAKPWGGEQPWLATVKAGNVYTGPVDYSESGVPFMDLAIPVTDRAGNWTATLLARVSLKALQDQVTLLKVGETGYVYITDEAGRVLIHRNLPLVPGGTMLAKAVGRTPKTIVEAPVNYYANLEGNNVMAYGVPMKAIAWYAIVEQPVGEALSLFVWLATGSLIALVAAGVLTISIIRFTRHRIVFPLLLLRVAVDMLRHGSLGHRIAIQTKDELSDLADAFNTMSTRLHETIGSLEQRIAERTAESERRANQIATGAEISRAVSQVLDPEELLQRVADLIRERFDLYYVGVFLVDETGRQAVLRAGAGEAGRTMLERGHALEVGGSSMVGWTCANQQARIALDVGAQASRLANPLLPKTRSEMALPLRIGGRVLGALDIQSVQRQAFDENDIKALQSMADQIAVALENARLFQQAQASLREVERTNRLLTREAWEMFLHAAPVTFAEFHQPGLTPLTQKEAEQLAQEPRPRSGPEEQAAGGAHRQAQDGQIYIPLELRGQTIGALIVERSADRPSWSGEDLHLLEGVATQMAQIMDSARLFEETQRQVGRQQMTSDILARIRAGLTLEQVINTTVHQLGTTLGAGRVAVRLKHADESRPPVSPSRQRDLPGE